MAHVHSSHLQHGQYQRSPQLWSRSFKNKRRARRSPGNLGSCEKSLSVPLNLPWEHVPPAGTYHILEHKSQFISLHMCSHIYCCRDLKISSPECTWIPRTSWPKQSHRKQSNWFLPSTKNDTDCGTVVLDFWKMTDFKLPTTQGIAPELC